MPRLFDITTPKDKVALDAEGKGQATFTVSNSSGATARGRARAVPGDPVQEKWYRVDGDVERSLRADQTTQYTVTIAVPKDTPKGEFTLRLDMIGLDRTDEVAVEGPRVVVPWKGPAVPVTPNGGFPKWLIPVIAAVVLLVGGLVTWLLLRDGESEPMKPVPDVVAKTFEEADTILKEAGFTAKRGKTVPKANTAKDTVVDQEPDAGKEAEAKSVVTLDVASEAVAVPSVAGHAFSGGVVNQFTGVGLFASIKSEVSAQAEGTILRTDPAGGALAAKGDTVTLVLARPRQKTHDLFIRDLHMVAPDMRRLERSDFIQPRTRPGG